jgi:hypothetical protein
MKTRRLLVIMFAVTLSVTPQLVSTSNAAGTYFWMADFATSWAGSLPWAKNCDRVKVNASKDRSHGMREGGLAVAGRQENLYGIHLRPEG